MKKISMILLSVVLIASMFISCDNSTNMKDELVQVALSAGDGRSLIVSNETERLDSVNWFYTATKVSETQFDYGATSEEKEITLFGENKTILTLSQGKWDFELFGRKADGTLLYYGKAEGVLIIKSTTPTTVDIGVSPYTTDPGTLKIENVTIKLVTANGTTTDVTPNYLEIDNVEVLNFSGSYTKTGDAEDSFVGQHTVKVAYKATDDGEDYTIAEETIVVTVYGGRTTTITGNVSEETGSGIIDGEVVIKTEDTVTKTVVAGEPTVFTINVAPSNNISSDEVKNTTVSFPVGALTERENTLNITVNPIDADFTVGATGESATVGSISLQLNDAESSSFEGDVEITTYIAKQLSGVKVYYNGSVIAEDTAQTDIYDPETGKLTFTTNHFSDFYVGANKVEAYNAATKISYSSVIDAFANVREYDKIIILKDIVVSGAIEVTKSVTIEGLGHELSCDNGDSKRVINVNDNTEDISLVINNLKIVGPTSGTYTRGISAYNNSGKLYIELNNCELSANYYAMNIAGGNNDVEVVVRDSTLTGWCAAQSWSIGSKFTFENCILIGTNDKSYNADGWNNFATIVINADAKENEFTFNKCIFKANQTTGNKQYLMSVRSSGNKVTLEDCKYFADGSELTLDTAFNYFNLYSVAIDLILTIDGDIIPLE